MTEYQFYGAEPAHRYANDRSFAGFVRDGESSLNIADQIVDNVVLVPILRMLCRVRVLRLVALRHDKDQVLCGEARDIGVVRPIAKTTISAMEQIGDGKFGFG